MTINQDNNKYILAWFLGTAFGMAMSYFFGSSEGSKEKTKLLGDK